MGTRDVLVASVAATVGAAVVFGLGIGLKEANSSSSENSSGTCIDGTNGTDGAQGSAGPSGAPGTNGTNGEDGAQGSAGPSGAPGDNGTNGTNGTNGVDGVCNASTLASISGNVVPAVDNFYTLGLPDYRWKSLQLGPGTIYIEDTTTGAQAGIAVDDGSLLVDGADSLRIGNIRLTSTGLESIISNQDISIGNRGDLGFLVPSRGIKFPDGTTQTTATLQGPTGPQGVTGATGPQGPAGPMPSFAYGSFYDTTTQTLSSANTAQAMSMNQSTNGVGGVIAQGVSVVSGSRITFAAAGVYNIQFSAQMDKTDAGSDDASIWLRQNGADVAWSNTNITLDATKRSVAAWNFMISVNAGDYVQLMWSTPDVNMRILAGAAGTNPTRPAIPSLILTVQQVK
jgi:hypothetical protein